jgi:type II secretory pathway pseudopilin PulG
VVKRQHGFTYLGALFLVALMAGALALTGEVWETSARREKEAELLYVGNQYRQAIASYYWAGPKQYPKSLEDLLRDQRKPGIERHLRKLYPDPVAGKEEWGLVRAYDGGIQGVYSLSPARPAKRYGFKPRDRELEGAATYTDWKFIHTPAESPIGDKAS